MPGMFCALPEGKHWPHRYVERNWLKRIDHELRLRRYGYTSRGDMVRAIVGRVRVTL